MTTIASSLSPRVSADGFVGRTVELRALVAALSQDSPAVVVIMGEPGIGKSRLVTELRSDSAVSDRRQVVGVCRRIGDPFPLGPIVEGLLRHRADLAGASLSSVTGALRPLLPELSDVLPELPAPLDDHLAERHRVFRALAEILAALGPVLLVVEDLHWADDQTVEFLGYLIADPPAGLAVVLTCREEDLGAPERMLIGSIPAAMRTQLDLTPLDEAETGALAARILDFAGLSQEFAAYLWERTSGVPLAIEELLALMQARRTLIRHGAGWVRRALDELDVPRRIRDAVLERVGRMPEPARAVLDTVAVLQQPHPVEVIVATSGRTESDVLDGLDDTLTGGILVDDGSGVGFRHALAAQAVYEAIPATRRRQLHGRAAEALRAHPTGQPLGQIAHHLRHAGGPDVWADAVEQAADKAIELRHDAEACRLLEDILRNAPLSAADRGRVAVKLGRAARDAMSTGPDVTALLMQVLDDGVPTDLRGELRFLIGIHLARRGDDDPAVRRDLYVQAVDELDHRPDLQAWVMVGLGIPSVPGVRPTELRDWLHRALQIVPTVDDDAFRVFLWGKAAMVLTAMGDPAWSSLVDRVVAHTDGEPRTRREVKAYDSVAIEACYAGHHRTAETLVQAGLRGATQCDSRMLDLRLQRTAAVLDYCTGRWTGLDDRVRLLADDLADYPQVRAAVDAVAGCLALARGDLDAAHRRLTEVTSGIEDVGAYVLLPLPAVALMRLRLARGEPDEAVRVGTAVLAGAESYGLLAPAARLVPALVEAMIAAGAAGDADALTRRLVDVYADLDAPLGAAAVEHARGHLDAAAGRWAAAVDRLTAAVAGYESARCRYEAAQATEQLADCLDRSGETVLGHDRLTAALGVYRDLGADWDEARATRTARTRGLSVPGRHRGGRRGYGSALSPREREVAELVAIGRSNDEIGRELYLSTKTVEKHVSAAKRKLGAPSRAAVAHLLAADDNAQD